MKNIKKREADERDALIKQLQLQLHLETAKCEKQAEVHTTASVVQYM